MIKAGIFHHRYPVNIFYIDSEYFDIHEDKRNSVIPSHLFVILQHSKCKKKYF